MKYFAPFLSKVQLDIVPDVVQCIEPFVLSGFSVAEYFKMHWFSGEIRA